MRGRGVIANLFRRLQIAAENANLLNVAGGSSIHPSATLRGAKISGLVKIEEHAKIIGGVRLHGDALISIGRYVSLNGPNTDVYSLLHPVSIGSFSSVARGVAIQEFNHNMDRLSSSHIQQNVFGENRRHDVWSKGPITIGHDVWIGTQCVILSGAEIGSGAVIAANTVVSGSVPPYAIVAGSPAQVVKYRFDPPTIQLLLDLAWWNWTIDKIRRNRALFSAAFSTTLLDQVGIVENDGT